MTLKAKKITNNDFSKKLNDEREYRSLIINDDLFKRLKFKALNEDKSLYEILNTNLLEVIKLPKEKIKVEIQTGKKRSFAISKKVLKQVKFYCIDNNLKVQDVIVYCLYV